MDTTEPAPAVNPPADPPPKRGRSAYPPEDAQLSDDDLEQVAGGAGCLQWIDSVGCSLDSV